MNTTIKPSSSRKCQSKGLMRLWQLEQTSLRLRKWPRAYMRSSMNRGAFCGSESRRGSIGNRSQRIRRIARTTSRLVSKDSQGSMRRCTYHPSRISGASISPNWAAISRRNRTHSPQHIKILKDISQTQGLWLKTVQIRMIRMKYGLWAWEKGRIEIVIALNK